MYLQRKIFPYLKEHLDKKQVTVLTGMRRTGKTTLVKQLLIESRIKQKLFFDLERIDNRNLFSKENYESIVLELEQRGFDFSEKILIAIDEIQLVSNLPSVIKYLYDNYDIKFILTGSSSYYIRNNFQESLAGRKKIFEIFTLDFGEFLTFNNVEFKPLDKIECLLNSKSEYLRLKDYYNQYIEFGGFPEVALAKNDNDKRDILFDIISSYIRLDIMQFSDIRKIDDLEKIMKLLTSRIGTKLEISKLANSTKVSRVTVENYLTLLESTYFVSTIPVLSRNPDKEIVKAKKVYFTDTGIATVLGDISGGVKFENTMYNQLKHWGKVSYYQMKTGAEIDFIINNKFAFEVKETAYENDLKKAERLGKNIDVKKAKVIAKNIEQSQENENIIWGGMIR